MSKTDEFVTLRMARKKWDWWQLAQNKDTTTEVVELREVRAQTAMQDAELVDVSVPECIGSWRAMSAVDRRIAASRHRFVVPRECLEWLATAPLAALRTDEPGAPICETSCPCCGADLVVENGPDEGEIAVVGTGGELRNTIPLDDVLQLLRAVHDMRNGYSDDGPVDAAYDALKLTPEQRAKMEAP